MTNIHITIDGAQASATVTGPITAGAVGIPVTFRFDSGWEELTRTAVFRAGELTLDRIDVGEETTLPAEITGKCGCMVYIGVYGAADDGSVVIPTVWAEAGTVQPGADPSGDESTDPVLPVWQQVQLDNEARDAAIAACVRSVGGKTPDAAGDVALPITVIRGYFVEDGDYTGAIFEKDGEPWTPPQDAWQPILAHFVNEYEPNTGHICSYTLFYQGSEMDRWHSFGGIFVLTDRKFTRAGKTYYFWEE